MALPAPSSETGTAEVNRVIVTGTNIPTANEVGPNPVDTYSPEDIEKLGARTATDLTQRIPAISGVSVTENISNLGGGARGGDGRTEINLRALFAKETLVLVDGKRVAPVGFAMGASVDINLIPWPLVDHIDILKDGASAIYGSDAIAGVFNVFLRHQFRGLEIGASYGNTNLGASNDAAERQAYLLAGTGDEKTEIVVFAEDYDRAALFSRDRGISSNADFRSFGGTDQRSGNFPGRVGAFVLRPGLLTPTPHSAPNAAQSPEYVRRVSLPVADQLFNFAALAAAIPAADRQYYYGAIARDVWDKNLTVFADFKVVRTFFDSTLAPVPFAPDAFKQAGGIAPVSSTGISVPLSNPFNPFTVPDAFLPDGTPVTTGIRYRALEAGSRSIKTTTNDYLFDGGVRGSLAGFGDYFKTWTYEIAFRYDANDHYQSITGIVSKPALREALLDTNPATAFNPFGRNINTPAALRRVIVSTQEDGVASLTDETALLTGDLIKLPAGSLSFAAGTEHRKETVNDQPDALNTAFESIGGEDLQATRATRDVWSYFGELRIPVTSPSWNVPGLHSLEFQVAERTEFYSDTSLAERPKFSVRYQPFDSSLTLRASYTEAFHAPDLSDLSPAGLEETAEFFDPAHLDAHGNPEPVVTRVLFGGQPNLRPEVAYGWNYGAVWTPTFVRGLTISLDFYHIDLRDRTNQIDTQFIIDQNVTSNGTQFAGQVVRDAAGNIILVRNLIQNISRTITEGIDYEAIYELDTAIFGRGNFGKFTFTLNGTYLSRYVAAINIGDKELEYAGQETAFGGYLPHNKLYTSVFYDLGGLDAGTTVHFTGQGSETDVTLNPLGLPGRKIREWTTVDVIASYTFNAVASVTENQVPGYSKDLGQTPPSKSGKANPVALRSSAAYRRGWKDWLNQMTITVGINNLFDLDPPFAASSPENGYDESAFNIKGRFWYVSVKKRF